MAAAGARITVIVCTYNGADALPSTLTALKAQTLDRDAYEILVVDDGSSDGSSSVAEELGARVVRQEPNGGIAAARNAGIAAARTPLVAFTDDDCEPEPDWLAELVQAFEDPSVDGVSGRVKVVPGDGIVLSYLSANNPLRPLPADLLVSSKLPYRLWLYLRGLAQPGNGAYPAGSELYSVVGANMAFRTEFLEELRGFDPAFRFGGEEEELCRRAHERPGGARFVYLPEAVVHHSFEEDVGDTLRRARAYGRGNARQAAKHPGVRLILYPAPLAVALGAAAAVTSRSGRVALATALLPLVSYFGWSLAALRRRTPRFLVFPYLQLAQETATMAGELEGLRTGYVPEPWETKPG